MHIEEKERERIDWLLGRNALFWLSRNINRPLLPPDMVQVNFGFRCNLRCKMCNMHEQMESMKKQNRNVEIDTWLFKKIIKDTKELGAKTILLIGGEPFLREDLFELIKYARSFDLNTAIVSNGVLLKEKNIEACFDAGLQWITVSVDAASEKVFSQIRGQNILRTITDNITELNRLKKQRGMEFPKISVCCTVMNENLEELVQVAKLCRTLEVSKVFFQPVVACNSDQTQRRDEFAGSIPPERLKVLDEALSKLMEYKKSSPSHYSFVANSLALLELMKKYFRGRLDSWEVPCYAGYNRLQIVQEGMVYFCVNQNQYESTFGDIRKNSLKELWYSKKANDYRKLIKECRAPCLQWCSLRDEFIELAEFSKKKDLFVKS